MAEFVFGELICYHAAPKHGSPLLFLGVDPRQGKIVAMSMDGVIGHLVPERWKRCDHLGGFAPGIRDVSGTVEGTVTGVRVLVGGVDVTDQVALKEIIPHGAYQVTAAIDGPFELRYDGDD